MFTNNYINFFKGVTVGFGNTYYQLKNKNGDMVYLQGSDQSYSLGNQLASFAYANSSSMGSDYAYLALGNNDTIETADDYNVGFISGITLAVSTSYEYSNSTYISRLHFSLTNSSNEAISFKEFGIYATMRYKTEPDAASSSHDRFLIYRKVLDNTVTIQPSEGVTLTVEFSTEV